MQRPLLSYAAIGDSFAEGMGDELPDGTLRGWADLVALGLAAAAPTTVTYANLAVRGRLLQPLLDEQLEPAIKLRPDLISISGGNNDIIRPRVSIATNTAVIEAAINRAKSSGAHVLFVTVANMTRHLPLGRLVESRGNQFARAIQEWDRLENVTVVNNWIDQELYDVRYWGPDGLHLNTAGHFRVAANVLTALDVPVPNPTGDGTLADIPRPSRSAYLREYLLPWIGRRLTGRSSGDGRTGKRPTLEPVILPA
jgi:lysophospholipase L1-like esterase